MINAPNSVNNGIPPVTDPGTVVQKGYQATAPRISNPEGSSPQEVAEGNQADDASTLRAAVTKLNTHAQNLHRVLSFSIDESTGRTVIRVYDAETQELIRDIPPNETIRMAQEIERHNGRHLLQGQKA